MARQIAQIRRDIERAKESVDDANWEMDPAMHDRASSRLKELETELATVQEAEVSTGGGNVYDS